MGRYALESGGKLEREGGRKNERTFPDFPDFTDFSGLSKLSRLSGPTIDVTGGTRWILDILPIIRPS
eukprot:scaffold301_cov243-Pinguiococcus_pyrenoidosus.AAC.175